MALCTRGLLDYQGPAAEQLLEAQERNGGAIDGSDMGVGKTAQALAVVRHRDVPTLVVCPAVSVASWRRMGAMLGTSFSVLNYEMLRTGRTPFGQWANPRPDKLERVYKCSTCQQKFQEAQLAKLPRCPHHYLGIHCIETESKPHDYGNFTWHPNIKQLVFDEVHRCGALDSTLQSKMLLASKRNRIPALGLSATVADSPLDLRALGYVIGLHNYTDFYPWAAKRGCRKVPWGGFQFMVGEAKRKQIMAELHSEIFPARGARVRIADLGDKFPEVQITAELYDLKEAGRIDALYAEMDEAIQALNLVKAGDVVEHPLTVLLRARQEIELLTVPIYEELTADALAQGKHVAIFVNFRQTVEELCKRLKTQCRIDGSQSGEKGMARRRACMDDFQADKEPVIVCSAAAGGISIDLHDTHGNFPRLGLVAPGYDARQFRQIFGRLRRALARSKALYRVILCAGTVQEKVHRALSGKLDCMDALNDADLWAANLPLTKHSVEEIFLRSRT